MLAPERQNEILNMLTQRGGVVKMTEIAKKFGVSNETIRRDLEWLEKEGIATRIYGGAVLNGSDHIAPPYSTGQPLASHGNSAGLCSLCTA